jgi:hypothetical protein
VGQRPRKGEDDNGGTRAHTASSDRDALRLYRARRRRLLVNQLADDPAQATITVVVHWAARLQN